jgi:hypothetical protein
MPNIEPPDVPPRLPATYELPAKSLLYRLYRHKYGALAFNPTTQANPYRGGRFDSADGSYSYLYAASSIRAAVAETLLRHASVGSTKGRILPESAVRDLAVVRIRTTRVLSLVDLTGAHLHNIGQHDGWLTSCESHYYPQTRHWAVALRGWSESAVGFRWRPRHDNNEFAFVLFGDRTPADSLISEWSRRSISRSGREALEDALAAYGAAVL